MAKEKGPFPLFDAQRYLQGRHVRHLPENVRELIYRFGIRNSHLTSIAPTGTISMCADNVSGGIEPVFSYGVERQINTPTGPLLANITDYGFGVLGVKGRLSSTVSVKEHIAVLAASQRHVDSAVSKTINMDSNTPWRDFKEIYFSAWEQGCKGCTTFNSDGKRMALLTAKDQIEDSNTNVSCFIPDPLTGQKECG